MKKLYLLFLLLFTVCIANIFPQNTPQNTQSSQIFFTVTLNAANVGQSDTSKATGTGWAVLSADRKSLYYNVTYAQLTSAFSAAHFHLGAAGTNGPVLHPIQFNGNTATGTWINLPDSVANELLKGQIYINIHTSNYAAGEIRGQLTHAAGIPFSFVLNASQVTSVDTSKASGTGWAILNTDGSKVWLTYGITIAGLTSQYSAAHFHAGTVMQNGGVLKPITFTDSSAYGTWDDISDANLLAIVKQGVYVNVNTSNYPTGEIRGQLTLAAPISFYASIDGAQETPSVSTNAEGTGWFVMNSDSMSLAYRITYAGLSSNFTASHFHRGPAGSAGLVVKSIEYKGNTATGIWKNMPDSLVVALLKENLYVNVHSANHTGGEIRGQVLLNTGVAFLASLDGNQCVPPVLTGASGTAWLSLVNDSLKFRVTVAGLLSAFNASHFHLAAQGANGIVVEPIAFTDSLASGIWANLDNSNLTALLNENLYINVHTLTNPTGEIRGQVLASSYSNIDSILTDVNDNEIKGSLPAEFELSQNYPNPFNPSTVISYRLAAAGIVTLKVYDLLGREVATLVNEYQQAGRYSIQLSTNHYQLTSGVYFYRLTAGSYSLTRKMVLLK